MNLRQVLIQAGGPGSGPHGGMGFKDPHWNAINKHNPEEQAKTITMLKSMGFEPSGMSTDPTDSLHFRKTSFSDSESKKEKGLAGGPNSGTNHSVVVWPNGSWTHKAEASHIGTGAEGLKSIHLGASMAKFSPEDQVFVREKQMRGNCSEIRTGKVVSATADRVTVAFQGEFLAKDFPIDKVSLADKDFGLGFNADNPYDQPVQKYVPRHF